MAYGLRGGYDNLAPNWPAESGRRVVAGVQLLAWAG
jgi:hypothetical protein